MSLHKKDWLGLLALGGLGAATGGFGLLGGGLLGGAGAGASGGILGTLLGTPEIGAAYGAAIPELGVAGPEIGAAYGSAIPELGAAAENPGLLGRLGSAGSNPNALRMLALANDMNQQPQQQVAPMQRSQPQSVQLADQPMSDDERKRRLLASWNAGSFLP